MRACLPPACREARPRRCARLPRTALPRLQPCRRPAATAGQLRNLERSLGESVRLCDRTALILDIFSQRAATREGKLQVGGQTAEPQMAEPWQTVLRGSSPAL